ncbi:MAG: DMT family transporter [Gammaproteobacteria bacterium]
MSPVSDNAKGIFLAAGGVVALSPDSLLIRMIDLDLWTLAFLRGLFIAAFLSLWLGWVHGIRKRGWHDVRRLFHFDAPGWGMAVSMSVGMTAFVAAIQTTSVAHTLIIVGSIPIITALLAFLVLGEAVDRRTRITMVVVFICLIAVTGEKGGESTLRGDFYALLASLAMAFNFVLARRTRVADRLATVALGGLLIALGCLPVADLSQVSPGELGLAAMLGVFVATAYSLLMLAPRFVPAAEVAVFLPLETVLGTALVWLILGERPSPVAAIAGLGVVLAIMLNSHLKLRSFGARFR